MEEKKLIRISSVTASEVGKVQTENFWNCSLEKYGQLMMMGKVFWKGVLWRVIVLFIPIIRSV